jgi:hypothetical protein
MQAFRQIEGETLHLLFSTGVTGVIEGKFTVSYNFLLIKRLRWPLTRCDTTDFAVQYGYIALSV